MVGFKSEVGVRFCGVLRIRGVLNVGGMLFDFEKIFLIVVWRMVLWRLVWTCRFKKGWRIYLWRRCCVLD